MTADARRRTARVTSGLDPSLPSTRVASYTDAALRWRDRESIVG